jgi:hypothetical protein
MKCILAAAALAIALSAPAAHATEYGEGRPVAMPGRGTSTTSRTGRQHSTGSRA